MPDELALRPQPLPTPEDWEQAVERAETIFGVKVGAGSLTAAHVAQLAEKLQTATRSVQEACAQLPELLLAGGHHLGMADKAVQRTVRYRTAVAVASVLHGLEGQEPAAALSMLAQAKLDTSAAAMAESIQSSDAVTTALTQADWTLYDAVASLTDSRQTTAQALLRDLSEALQADEYVVTLVPLLTDAKQRAIHLLTTSPTPAPVAPLSQRGKPEAVGDGRDLEKSAKLLQQTVWQTMDAGQKHLLDATDWDALAAHLQAQLRQNPALRLSLTWNLVREEIE